MKRLSSFILLPALLLASPALATGCIDRPVDGGIGIEAYVTGYAGAHAHAVPMHGTCRPRDFCVFASLSEPVNAPVTAEREIELPNTSEFALLDKKATLKAIALELLAAVKERRKPRSVAPVYTDWQPGSCD